MKTRKTKPPTNARRIYRWTDLPNTTERASYVVQDDGGEPREIVISRHQRQVLEGLMQSPIFAASYCRISDQVLPLRRDHGVDIRCDMYANDPETGRQRYGVYTLVSTVTRSGDARAAA